MSLVPVLAVEMAPATRHPSVPAGAAPMEAPVPVDSGSAANVGCHSHCLRAFSMYLPNYCITLILLSIMDSCGRLWDNHF